MATVSFDKNIIVEEPEAVEKLIEILSDAEVKPINKDLASPEVMTRGEELLKQYLSRLKNL